MAERVRIQKAIANAGLMSRRAAEDAMVAGRVRLNGQPVVLGDRCETDVDIVTLDGVPIPLAEDLETYLIFKPKGVISTAHDTHGRPTVVDLIDTEARIYPVGRLDADSEGLLLVSNDGVLTERVTHPRYGVRKTYLARVEGTPAPKSLRRLRTGVTLEDGPAKAVSCRLVDSSGGAALVEVIMTEGRNREVRRMLDAVGHPVTRLVRTGIGSLRDPGLKPGEWRRLSAREIKDLLDPGDSPS